MRTAAHLPPPRPHHVISLFLMAPTKESAATRKLFPAGHPLRKQLVPIDTVAQHPDNPRNGDVDVIVESIRSNGVYRPVIVQQSTGHIIAGNHTYAALLKLGSTAVPAVVLDVDDDRAKRIMLVDNRSADRGEYDEGQLLELLRELDGLEGTGYEHSDVDNLEAITADDRWDGGPNGSKGAGEDDGSERFWPKIEIQLPPHDFDRLRVMLDRHDGPDDAAKMVAHLDSHGIE